MTSRLIVNSIRHTGGSADALTLASDGTCTANITNKPNRNLIINGAMQVAQRGTSSTTLGMQTVDRFSINGGGLDENPTQERVGVASGTTPYTLGFRNAFKITNGNQNSPAVSDYLEAFVYRTEAQDIAQSGWNYNSASSKITLSFWCKSSITHVFSGSIEANDTTGNKMFKFSTPSISANTWTKVTVSIIGDSNLTINNDNGIGLLIRLYAFIGSNFTTSDSNTETWISGSIYANNMSDTWYTTNDATFELTGVQLEVDHTGSGVATDFEHRSFGQELALCQRYFYKTYRQGIAPGTDDTTDLISKRNEMSASRTDMVLNIAYSVPMRATPTIVGYSKAGNSNKFLITGIDYSGGSEGTFAGTVYRGRKYLNQLSAGTTVPSGSYAHFHFTADAEL
jgi:hypothetical protein